MITLLRISAVIVLLTAVSGNASAYTLTASTTNNTTGSVAPGQPFNFSLQYSWSAAPTGSHTLRMTVNLPQTLEYVSSSLGVDGASSATTLNFTIPAFSVSSFGTGSSGSNGLILTVRFKSSAPGGTQACLTGSVYEGPISTSTGYNCVTLAAAPPCPCSGVISYSNLTNSVVKSGVLLDFGTIPGGPPCGDPGKQSNCTYNVGQKVAQMTAAQRQQLATDACAAGVANGTLIRAYSMVAPNSYVLVQTVGTLVNTPQQTQTTCNCPPDWTSNTSNTAGGITTDGKCKKQVASMTISPAPPNTNIGTWGFTVGNDIYVWGNSANGGAPVCTTVVTAPKVCSLP